MNTSQKLESALRELQKLTDLPLQLTASDDFEAEELLLKVQALSTAYKEAHNKESILRRWITNDISTADFFSFTERMHIDREDNRGIYLVQLKHDVTSEIITVLKNMIHDSASWIIPYHNNQLIIILRFPKRKKTGLKEKAYEILTTFNTELMEHAMIAYGEMTTSLEQLPDAYQKAYMALQVGRIFYPDRTIFDYTEMGIGCLLYDVSEVSCREYIRVNLGPQFLTEESPIFQSDILQTALCFLNNNLNIAETARQLHIHRNTLLYRLEQIQNETGMDIRRFEHAMSYKLCSMILFYLKNK